MKIVLWHYILISLVALSTLVAFKDPWQDDGSVAPLPVLIAPQPLQGWVPEYDEFIKYEVRDEVSLMHFPGRLMDLCPHWGRLNEQHRTQFYADLLYSIAGPESTWTRTAMHREPRLGVDAITGMPLVSEGLLQMSYQDAKWYHCNFDYEKDEKAYLDDWNARTENRSWVSNHPERSTLNAYNNLQCGLLVMSRLASRKLGESFTKLMGRYWAVMRSERPGYQRVVETMQDRAKYCYE